MGRYSIKNWERIEWDITLARFLGQVEKIKNKKCAQLTADSYETKLNIWITSCSHFQAGYTSVPSKCPPNTSICNRAPCLSTSVQLSTHPGFESITLAWLRLLHYCFQKPLIMQTMCTSPRQEFFHLSVLVFCSLFSTSKEYWWFIYFHVLFTSPPRPWSPSSTRFLLPRICFLAESLIIPPTPFCASSTLTSTAMWFLTNVVGSSIKLLWWN